VGGRPADATRSAEFHIKPLALAPDPVAISVEVVRVRVGHVPEDSEVPVRNLGQRRRRLPSETSDQACWRRRSCLVAERLSDRLHPSRPRKPARSLDHARGWKPPVSPDRKRLRSELAATALVVIPGTECRAKEARIRASLALAAARACVAADTPRCRRARRAVR
jgi:hypothetical protein